jgi:DNA-binding CsgD family transcriptional regulator
MFDISSVLNLIFRETRVQFQGYKEDLQPRSDGYINEFSKNEKSVKIIFDQVNFKVLNISENLEALTGHSAVDMRKSDISFFLKFIAFEHILFLYVWLRWTNQMTAKNGMLHDPNNVFCGVNIKHKKGHIMRLMLRQSGLEFLENGAMKVSVISADDITHLLRSDFYWGRSEFGPKKQYVHHLVSTDKKDMPQDIISDREKEVLRLVAEDMESKEIAKILSISQHTVDNHRRNTIAKIGARDTTSLIQICRMAGII